MPNPSFMVIPYGSPNYTKAVALREEILRKPLGLTFTQEELTTEQNHIHIAGFIDNQLVAACVLVPEADKKLKMQRVAVRETSQNKGIGSAMMAYCENWAISHGIDEIYVSARAAEGMTAVPFYLKHGYACKGGLFNEDGIPHQMMHKKITTNQTGGIQP